MLRARFFFLGSLATLATAFPAATNARADQEAAFSAAPTVPMLLSKGREAEAQFLPERALAFFQQADAQQPNDPLILQAIAKQLSDELDGVADREKRVSIAREALVAAKRAAQLEPRNALCVVSVAVCYGKLAIDADTKERVESSREVKSWAEAALELDPHNEWAEHILGVWNLQVSQIGSAKRAFAHLLYGELPTASLADAVSHLQKAVEFGPKVAVHHIELGFAYLKTGDADSARREFNEGLALPSRDRPDETAKARARVALGR